MELFLGLGCYKLVHLHCGTTIVKSPKQVWRLIMPPHINAEAYSVYPVRLSVCLSVSQSVSLSVSRQFPFPCDNFPTVSPFFTILHMYIDINHGKTPIESEVRRPKVKVTSSINRLVFAHFFRFRAITWLPCIRSSWYFTCTFISIMGRRLSKVRFVGQRSRSPVL